MAYQIYIIYIIDIYIPRWCRGKETSCSAGHAGLIPGLGRSPGEGNDNPLQYSCLRNPRTEEPGEIPSLESPRVRYD